MDIQRCPSIFLLLVLIALPHCFPGLHVRNSSEPVPNTNSTRPPTVVTESIVEEEDPLLALPDDSLADADLHDHDVIDSVVYLYFGGDAALSPRTAGGSSTWMNDGWWLWWAAGPVLSIPPQALTLWSALRRLQRRRRPRRRRRQVEDPRYHYAPPLLVGILATCLAASGSLLLAGGTWIRLGTLPCLVLAMVTHYIHLVCAVGLAALPILTLRSLPSSPTATTMNNSQARSLCVASSIIWILPAPILYACYNWNSRGYEWRHYCWLSVEGGMVLSFLAPVATLILIGTVASLMALRRISASTAATIVGCGARGYQNLAAARRWIRAGATLLPMFAVSWFCSVIAIENLDSLLLVTMSSASFISFNWTLFVSSYMALPNSNGEWSLPFNNHQIAAHPKASCQCKLLSRNDCPPARTGDPDAKPLLSDVNDETTWENVLHFISEAGTASAGGLSTLVENEESRTTPEDSLELQVDSISLISS
ncbi:uncharacterized protein LOC124166750 [Ischnura elegans]|uniref:uncharacterized protein LOC124166750 n=1 Tax=Ischnura elegans TaxID=197161 RepID=UPI001ED87BA8|nr:uncharacterized protein LOC124166750 [Ischnura elegans]